MMWQGSEAWAPVVRSLSNADFVVLSISLTGIAFITVAMLVMKRMLPLALLASAHEPARGVSQTREHDINAPNHTPQPTAPARLEKHDDLRKRQALNSVCGYTSGAFGR